MRRPVAHRTIADLKREFPIDDLVPGWFFRVDEVSNGAFRARGSDAFSRIVESTAGDPDLALADCKAAAQQILGQLDHD